MCMSFILIKTIRIMTYSNGLLPDGFKNFKIVDLSDIHITTSKDIDRFEQIVD